MSAGRIIVTRGYTAETVYAFFLARMESISELADGTVGTLPGYWTETPAVAVGIADIATYSPSYKDQSQTINASLYSSALQEDGTCDVTPIAALSVAGGSVTWSGGEEDIYDTGGVRYAGETHSFITSAFEHTSVKSITATFRTNSGSSGLYYTVDGVKAYWMQETITIYYSATDGVSESGYAVLLSKQMPYSTQETLCVSFELPDVGDYSIRFQIDMTSLRGTKDGQLWTLYNYYGFIGAEIMLGASNAIYEGKMQMIGIGR